MVSIDYQDESDLIGNIVDRSPWRERKIVKIFQLFSSGQHRRNVLRWKNPFEREISNTQLLAWWTILTRSSCSTSLSTVRHRSINSLVVYIYMVLWSATVGSFAIGNFVLSFHARWYVRLISFRRLPDSGLGTHASPFRWLLPLRLGWPRCPCLLQSVRVWPTSSSLYIVMYPLLSFA